MTAEPEGKRPPKPQQAPSVWKKPTKNVKVDWPEPYRVASYKDKLVGRTAATRRAEEDEEDEDDEDDCEVIDADAEEHVGHAQPWPPLIEELAANTGGVVSKVLHRQAPPWGHVSASQ